MKLPHPNHSNYSTLVNDIERGVIKIPQFQREFVWTTQKSAALLDSIVKGYPVGTFIFWATRERLRSVREIGNHTLPSPRDGDSILFVLDGQQRITSLFAALKGLTVARDSGQQDDFSALYIDLDAPEEKQVVITDVSAKPEHSFIRVTDLLHGSLKQLAAYPANRQDKLDEYRRRIESYSFPIIEVRDVPLDVATEIFTRINVTGQPLTLFEIMVAKTYDEANEFDLAVEFDKLIGSLTPLDYETISDASMLQLVSLLIKRDCKRQSILRLDKVEFANTWRKATDAVERAVEYFRNTFRIPVSQLLPYNILIVPFSFYFYYHADKPPAEHRRYLEDFFWRVSLVGRYSSGVEGKLAQDIRRIEIILENGQPEYDWGVDVSDRFILENGWFNAGRSYIKAILCLYAFQIPQSFSDGALAGC